MIIIKDFETNKIIKIFDDVSRISDFENYIKNDKSRNIKILCTNIGYEDIYVCSYRSYTELCFYFYRKGV